jgi:hypothetical protein
MALSICQMPTAIRFPIISEMEFPQNQIPWRRGCSDVRYQSEVRRLKPGETEASVQPRKNLITMRPVKLVVAAWHASTTAHMILFCG